MGSIEKTFPSYLSAVAECGDGYRDADIAKVVAYRTRSWKDTLKAPEGMWLDQITNPVLGVGIAGADLATRPLRVLDFGGGCGVHYFFARFAFRLPLKWVVVESTMMAEYAMQVSEGEFDAHDKIELAVDSLSGVDLVLTSGALQYTSDPLATLDSLIAIGAPYFMLARFPFWHDTMFAVEQAPLSGHDVGPMPPGTPDKMMKCPITFVKYAEVKTKLENVYDRLLSIPSPSADYQFGGQTITAGTHVYRRKS